MLVDFFAYILFENTGSIHDWIFLNPFSNGLDSIWRSEDSDYIDEQGRNCTYSFSANGDLFNFR